MAKQAKPEPFRFNQMNRFNRDFALIRISTGQVMAESHNAERLEQIRQEYAEEDIECEVVALSQLSPR